jgi:YD repeat-containing protein
MLVRSCLEVHQPAQNAGTATIWDYNPDDTVQKVTDARGSVSNFSYNARHLITGMTYDPSTGISDTPDVSFGYDAAGNRTSMTDGLGSVSYVYDQLSRMTSESRTLTGVGSFNLSYGYNLAAQLTSITDPFGAQVGYTHDTTGRVTTVSGANFGSVSTYASNIQYRAAGALKYLDYGNSRSLSMSYNTRLQPASFTVPVVVNKTYDYQADGRLKFSHDLMSPVFDRSYAHDHAGRISEALSGAEARNEGTTNNRPYKQSFVYDALGHLTERPVNKLWSEQGGVFSPAQQTYVNERNTAWTYNADGNLTDSGAVDYTLDAAGQTSRFVSYEPIDPPPGQPIEEYGVTLDVTQSRDGDAQVLKKLAVNTVHGGQSGDETTTHTTYLLRSSVLGGQVITELGASERGFVYLGGSVLAVQERPTQTVKWEHRDAGNASIRMTSSNGTVQSEEMAELDPLGSNAGLSAPVTPSPAQYWKMSGYPGLGSPGTSMTCIMDFIPTPCSEVGRAMNAGVAAQCPDNNCGPRHNPDRDGRGRGGWETLWLFHNGFSYQPLGPSSRPPLTKPTLKPKRPRPENPDNGDEEGEPNPDPQKTADQRCDDRLAGIFGGEGSVFATDRDPSTLADPAHRDRNRLLSPGESPVNGHGHIYASATGAGVAGGNLFTPSGYRREERAPYTAHQDTIPELQNYHRFTYLPGSLQRFGYSGGLVISFIHSGPTNSAGRPFPATASGTSGSVLVGTIGNFGGVDVGGSDPGYVHSHIRFYSANRRGKIGGPIDPRSVFCRDLGF